MRTRALLVGGALVVSALLPSTNAQAFFWRLDQSARQAPAAQHSYEGRTYRFEPGYGGRSDTRQAAYGRQNDLEPSSRAVVTDTPSSGQVVDYSGSHPAGSIVVKTSERRLYLVLGGGKALRYPVGVGRVGKQWNGSTVISGKYLKPAWSPPEEIRRDKPSLPDVIPGGTAGNPMGVAALTLSGGEYAIHGTNKPSSIGGFVSYGCIRMHNRDILDLYARVSVGTPVTVAH